MSDLIPIERREVGGTTLNTCNARDLWQFVESKRKFADWIKDRIDRFGFVEGKDFAVHKFVTQWNQVDRIDYHLTIEMAKELAMVENNAKGREIRRYFIACERRAKEHPIEEALERFNVPKSYPEAMRLAADLAEQKEVMEKRLAIVEPKAAIADRIALADGDLNLTACAKTLQMAPRKLIRRLETDLKCLYRRPGSKHLLAYQDRIAQGLLRHKSTTVQAEDGEKVYVQALVTPKGLTWLAGILDAERQQNLAIG